MRTSEARALETLRALLAADPVPLSTSPPPAPQPTAPPAPVAFTHLSQLLPASTIAALARLEQVQQEATAAAEAASEAAWASWERNAGMARLETHDAAGSALAAPTADHLAWLRPDSADLSDVRCGYGDGSTTVATSGQH